MAYTNAGVTLSFEGISLPTSQTIKDAFPATLSSYKDQLGNGEGVDATIVVGEERFPAHKAVLIARIPFFKALFESNMAECDSGEVKISEITADIAKDLLHYAYTGEITVTESNVQSIFIAGSFLQIEGVMDACARFIRMRNTIQNAIPLLSFFHQFNYEKINDHIYGFFDKNFVSISALEDFLSLEVDDLEKLITRETLAIDEEEQMFTAIWQWLSHPATPSRMEYAKRLLQHVRLTHLSDAAMERIAAVAGDEWSNYIVALRADALEAGVVEPKRVCPAKDSLIFVLGGVGYTDEVVPSKVEFYDPTRDEWHDAKTMISMRDKFGAEVVGKKIFAIGGNNKRTRMRNVEVYDTETNEWSVYPDLLTGRAGISTALIDGKIIVCGGFDGTVALRSMEILDTKEEEPKWIVGRDMKKMRGAAGFCVLDGKLYVFGGHDGREIHADGERYDPATNTWETLAPMNVKRCRFPLAALNGFIYAVGGFDGIEFFKKVERYDPATNTWTKLRDLPYRRSRPSLMIASGKMFMMGGFNGILNVKTMSMYHPERDEWEEKAPMKSHSGHIVVASQSIPAAVATPAVNLDWGDRYLQEGTIETNK